MPGLVSNLVGVLLPAYRSLKAVERPRQDDDERFLTYCKLHILHIIIAVLFALKFRRVVGAGGGPVVWCLHLPSDYEDQPHTTTRQLGGGGETLVETREDVDQCNGKLDHSLATYSGGCRSLAGRRSAHMKAHRIASEFSGRFRDDQWTLRVYYLQCLSLLEILLRVWRKDGCRWAMSPPRPVFHKKE
jgi:hypothetical protein